MSGIHREGEMRRPGDKMKRSRFEIGLNRIHSEISGSAFREHVVQRQGSEVHDQAWRAIGKTDSVVKREVRTPFDVNILRIVRSILFQIGRYKDELLLHQEIDFQS